MLFGPESTMGDILCIPFLFNNATSEKSPRMVGTARLVAVERVNATGNTQLFLIDDDGKVIVIRFVMLLLSMQSALHHPHTSHTHTHTHTHTPHTHPPPQSTVSQCAVC